MKMSSSFSVAQIKAVFSQEKWEVCRTLLRFLQVLISVILLMDSWAGIVKFGRLLDGFR